jgi:hypothetical protein
MNNVFKAVAIGTILGFLIAQMSGCSSSSCGPNNCSGCCNPTTKQCISAANQTAAQCGGIVGLACGVCSGNDTCVAATCTPPNNNDAGSGCGTCPIGCCATAQNGTKFCASGTSLNQNTCGSGGEVCIACDGGSSCQVGSSGNGTCVMNGPDGGPSGGIGFPCATNMDCAPFLGSTGVCLTSTPDGGAAYPGGYCSYVACSTSTNAPCPGNSKCSALGQLGFQGSPPPPLDFYGETRSICLAGCNSDFDCNVPDYVCLAGNQLDGQGNFTVQSPFGCFINKPARAGETGSPCQTGPAGSTVPPTNQEYMECALPPTNGGCFAGSFVDGGPTGFDGGYCTSTCLGALVDQVNGPDYWCGTGGICLIDGAINAGTMLPESADCYSSCSSPYGGQSDCRAGYVCNPLTLGDGGLSSSGYCYPPCTAPAFACTAPGTCNAATGYCCLPPAHSCVANGDCCSDSCVGQTCQAADAGSSDAGDGG